MKIKKWAVMILLVLGFLLFERPVYAEEEAAGSGEEKQDVDVENALLNEFDFGDVDQAIEDIFPKERIQFKELLSSLISGETKLTLSLVGDFLKDRFFYSFNANKSAVVHILIIAVIAAIFTNFSNAFRNQQISEISFYILYLLLIMLCLNSFRIVMESVTTSLNQLTGFMKVLCPLYFLAVAIAKGSVTSVAFYNLVLILIFLVELLILNFLLPLVHVYIMVKVLNFLSKEDYLSKFAELLEMIVLWSLKTLLACIVGLNVIQGLIAPAIDTVKRSVLTRGAQAIPGIGDAIGGVAEVVLGTAVLLKNGIGVTGAIICIVICIVPIVEMVCLTLMYKFVAAIVQPVSDKRIVGCIESIGEGCQLLLRVTFTAGILFLITVAVVAASTT